MTRCLVDFENSEKCEILNSPSEELDQMPKRRRAPTRKGKKRSRRVGATRRSKVRIVNGRVGLKVAGFKGLNYIPASQLVRLMPVSKLRLAAKKILGKPPKRQKYKRRARKARK